MGFDHTGLPFMSKANKPALPEYTYTRSPSVAGVSDVQVFGDTAVATGRTRACPTRNG